MYLKLLNRTLNSSLTSNLVRASFCTQINKPNNSTHFGFENVTFEEKQQKGD